MIRAALIAIAAAGCGGAQSAGAPRCQGLEVTEPDQLAALRGCDTITGDLSISGAAIVDLDPLGSLRAIRGDLTIGPTSRLASARGLAKLTRVSGELTVARNFELGGVYVGSLVEVGGAVRIDRNLSLLAASLHRLVEVGGDLTVTDNGALERVDLSALERVGGDLTIAGGAELVVVLPEAAAVGGERHISPESR